MLLLVLFVSVLPLTAEATPYGGADHPLDTDKNGRLSSSEVAGVKGTVVRN